YHQQHKKGDQLLMFQRPGREVKERAFHGCNSPAITCSPARNLLKYAVLYLSPGRRPDRINSDEAL
ncbi:hypothetical protein ACEN8K_46865, partial [Variovorax sp. CT11-76]